MKAGIKKQVVLNLPLLVFVYVGNKISWLYRMIDTVDISKKVYGCLIYFSKAFKRETGITPKAFRENLP